MGLFKNEAEQKENFVTLQEKGYVRFENLPLETKDKKLINVEFVANTYQVNGTTVIQCNIREITERVRAEGKVKWLASFPEQDPSPILEMEKDAGISYINPVALKLFPEIDDLKMSHPYVNESEKFFRDLNGTDKSVERREIQIDGNWYLQDIKYTSPDHIRIYGHDITELKNIEYKLAAGKSFNDAILSSISEAVIVCDIEGKIKLFNRIAEQLSGVPASEAIGIQYHEVLTLVRESDGAIYSEFASKVIAENRIIRLEKQTLLVNKNGTKTPVAGSASPIPGIGGTAFGCVFAIYDATREHDIDKAKTEFVSLASHQMRTPLTAISWYSELLQSVKYLASVEKRGQFAQEINIASKRMSALVNSLLNVSRLEMGTFTIEPRVINPLEIAKLNLDTLRLQVELKHLTLKEEYDPKANSFLGDSNLLEIIFQNLLTNAIKYTPDGGSLTITVKNENALLNIIVSDTGVGIPQKDRDKIFGKLYRSDNVKGLDPGGSGLGLYIVHEIVQNSGGSIRFESEEGKGSTFYVTFPMTGMVRKVESRMIT
ncbi:MAG: Multi-sensor signal transduction histidine kinase [Candidatus Collierbacteria bacterium GW2011_GWC2_44_18]|uniref:histidine kinase n=1 Tax=Candidatus Collierbacteria bacterium GW2011_GWC2_44_18 TaxID=1618392 RepID=A0A0G1HQR2_9BACT|nr:MAG: Multi-sensor signal transduction histidine kinase [Candidatus Collierbacteria bacterium GW2011_GWC2_44_18]